MKQDPPEGPEALGDLQDPLKEGQEAFGGLQNHQEEGQEALGDLQNPPEEGPGAHGDLQEEGQGQGLLLHITIHTLQLLIDPDLVTPLAQEDI